MYGFKIRSLGPGTPLTECPVLAEADWGDIGTPPVTPADSHCANANAGNSKNAKTGRMGLIT